MTIKGFFFKVFKELDGEWNLVHANKKKVFHPAISRWRVAASKELQMFAWRKNIPVFGPFE